MTEHVIELLEPVHIEHDNAETPVLTNSIWQFTLERLIQVASVEQARQRIADGLIAQLFAELEIRKGSAACSATETASFTLNSEIVVCVPADPFGSVTRHSIPSVSPWAMRGVQRLESRVPTR